MTVFACKVAFASLGLEHITPSSAHASQDCSICRELLDLHHSHTVRQVSKLHAAVRIIACSHILGRECLEAWLEISNTCPYPDCRRPLYQATNDRITQQDVNSILRTLGPIYGNSRIMRVIARLVARQEQDYPRLHQLHAADTANTSVKDTLARIDESLFSDDDFLKSDDDIDFGEDDDFNEEVDAAKSTG
ncbi:hypothetical protein BKA66DRAFT_441563 [Pyrenochaeta sp. MPI-SDFR-AT-0127]|nr:hypothetical protein BKA66DRAFT_441563 [Pyrenochaeta sp. MPI-SDFR-AT-0127]